MSDTKISADEFQHIAKLSGLTINTDEHYIADQLSQAVEYVEILQKLDTKNIIPTFQVNHKKNVFRDDVVQPSLPQDKALSQANKKHNGFFVTQATIKK